VDDTEQDHLSAIGEVAATWEYLENTIELALLYLIDCPDYRGRLITSKLSFGRKGQAIRSILGHVYGDELVGKGSRYSELWSRIEGLRGERNRIIHAEWKDWKIGEGGLEAVYSSADDSTLTSKPKSYTASDIQQVSTKLFEAHIDFLNFFNSECNIMFQFDKYDYPPVG